ncbi:hypothetical protein BS78_K301700 [Paspalum vaginatum]|uniref:F-box domain-containing protein n=1 Tax=Paspalum vaginatum TaxID=158149 RepID=A0A9W7XAH5_9POAL|nr:hypothetical protein BS78_K301700 [Paspalum vaginatum]
MELELELAAAMGALPKLPLDVLEVILANLEIPDLVRAGSVCSCLARAAYTSLRNLGRYKQSQTPCLFYTSESAGDNVACLYSLVDKRVYMLANSSGPPVRTRFLIGSSNDWLVTVDERPELLLLNPFTGQQIALLSVVTIEHVKPIVDDSGSIHRFELSYYTGEKVYRPPEILTRSELREQLYFKAFVFPNPSTGSYIVVLIHHPYYQLSFAQAGDDRLHVHEGVLYALTELGGIDAFHLTGSAVTREVIVDKVKDYVFESMYIIPAPWGGDLLQVWREVDSSRPEQEDEDGDSPEDEPAAVRYITTKIIVYKVDLSTKELVNINRLPNQSLCLGSEQHPQLKANHAYFTDATRNGLRHRRKEIVFKIWSDWPCPTWIVPHITKMDLAFRN